MLAVRNEKKNPPFYLFFWFYGFSQTPGNFKKPNILGGVIFISKN
jgi:hypothetical protein